MPRPGRHRFAALRASLGRGAEVVPALRAFRDVPPYRHACDRPGEHEHADATEHQHEAVGDRIDGERGVWRRVATANSPATGATAATVPAKP